MIPESAQAPPIDAVRDFARDVRRDLALTPRQLQSKYLYNGLGSALFEAICRLPWYRITRAEGRLLARFAAEMVGPLEDPITLVELGSGSGEKLALLAEALRGRRKGVLVHLVDISPDALELSERTLGALEHVSIVGHRATYEVGLLHAASQRPLAGTMLVLFLGSNIGNFDPPAADEFLAGIRAALRPGDALLLGVDLVKPERELLLAYDDPLGVTAAFNKNVLARINTELLADFDLSKFAHRAVWNPVERRVEMHLESLADQTVRIARAECEVAFRRGEHIWTESSYKYDSDAVVRMGRDAGFRLHQQWIESDARFALGLFVAD
jgi:dimethylhistidine N-methyltransferase